MFPPLNKKLVADAILRIGEVSEIRGTKVFVRVDKDKNSSDLLLDGEIIKNVSVGSYIEIRKGFLSIIGKADGEQLTEDTFFLKREDNRYDQIDRNRRFLTLSLVGYIGIDGRFRGGIKELPLIGNAAFVLTDEKIHRIHNFAADGTAHITIAKTDAEEIALDFPIDGLFNSHVAVFGNTGSGKSNTVAALYQALFDVCGSNEGFIDNCQFLVFDFNGEYTKPGCITDRKRTYSLTTHDDNGDKLPATFDQLFDVETFSVLVEATDKTQKPFLRRALSFYQRARHKENFSAYLKAIIQNQIIRTLRMANKELGFKLLDYLEEALEPFLTEQQLDQLRAGLDFHNTLKEFTYNGTFLNSNPGSILETNLYKAADLIREEVIEGLSDLSMALIFVHLQLVDDAYKYKVQIEFIYGVINRFKAKKKSIERTFKIDEAADFWGGTNCVVINLHDVNLDMRKTIPLLVAKNVYNAHKRHNNQKSLNLIIDEAHNILSKQSFRETEEWKDYRLETFEEIIKEGRKFGVFLAISSQRPNDISETIISQAHNYFIHQLINEKDLLTIGNAVSYIDKATEQSIPTLPVGTCIFSGIATPMPLKIKITELPDHKKPESQTLKFRTLLSAEAS